MKHVLILLFIIATTYISNSQPPEISTGKEIFFDAVCFRSDSANSGRMDVFVIVPYSALYFVKSGDIYGAKYEINIKILDSNATKVKEEQKTFSLTESDYFVATGGTGKFDFSQSLFNLPAGRYEVETVVSDIFSKNSYKKSRVVTIIEFARYPFSLSGLMLVSAIEENGDKFIITPHISDNIGDLSDGFFTFFELYAQTGIDSVDFEYKIIKPNEESIFKSELITKPAKVGANQYYLRTDFPKKQTQGTYNIRITALRHGAATREILAISERSIKYFRSVDGEVIADIDKAVRQLNYIATEDELDFIEAAQTTEEKESRFEDFWLKKDPSPNTGRNEAFDQYYARIEYANKNFKSYTEGWHTDKGMVFVIYGKATNEERTNPSADGRTYERWSYSNGKQFTFVDNSGFGDFRLSYPSSVGDKYKYTPGE
jgi:GWxTD domain-containing protein